ncbi:MAG: choice-of-anchor D domain-containing protein, partial [Akkermansiaceae bacterium]|nr:choice-of-anchor D domain-containing protein [Akkermansiaceae bacterium]
LTNPVFPDEIAPGSLDEIALDFDPAGSFGDFPATVTISSNDPSDGTWEVALTVHVPDDPNLMVAAELAFPTLASNIGPQTASLAISNTGALEDLDLAEPQIGGPDAGSFSVLSFPSTLAAGQDGEIAIRFDTGGAAGDFHATLTLPTNDPTHPEIEVTLRGSLIGLPDAADLMVDFSRGDEGGVEPLQPGWQGFAIPATGGTV